MSGEGLILAEGAKTPPRKTKTKSHNAPDSAGTPVQQRRSDRIRKKMAEIVKDAGETITTPRGSYIHSKFPSHMEFLGNSASPRRVELDQFKRRLQFKSGARSNLMLTDAYKNFARDVKVKEFQEDQRDKRNNAHLKSRGLSLAAVSKTRQTSVTAAQKEGEPPKVQFVPRHNLRPRVKQVSLEESNSDVVLHDVNICGWGNPQKNLGNYLSICWDYNSDLDADKDQTLPERVPCILQRTNTAGAVIESGMIYHPQIIVNEEKDHLNGYCFTIQSELALKFESAQRVLFQQASDLIQASFFQYNMDLSLDSSLDDGFTVDIFVSSAPSQNLGDITVRGVTQFIFMKSYIYVDKICVAQKYHKMGIGAFMMERIYKIARKRNKDILLYALGPVIGAYKKWGFEYCKEWPPIPKDIGVIMRKRIRTEGVKDEYVGLEWDGTGFS
ncbi:hypothetical protein BCR41DRAFT_371926 [Lobosporangium transversale]|uniref:N-acetyltransferase domain-containing protein n=1 Tax=Lobosporangium transversale TaxID=64571 RepID=A0A1Y2GKB9_9FUNG|nr:hypothetical protein BCR41DRAFT_371926 [Lobosporangium transversale]ORZ12107.1 hypothetical protein BCR41DRAFT_371926 [Lobosporangium transversale]|eukprot:XP_021879972.1 hypothetical protein BCR41DRAFT_371926 [Lobosporangium transversale]